MAPSPETTRSDVSQLQRRLRLAHQARRAKERQLDDIRHALMDIGVIEEGDPYSHADLADVIRQLDSELNQEPATAQDMPDLKAQLTEAENQRDAPREELAAVRATIARVQAVAREWEFMSGRTAARSELLAALDMPAKEQQ